MAKTKKSKPKAAAPTSKRYHMPSAPKSRVHKTFDEKGKKAAESLATKLEISSGRLKRWFREWGENRASA